MDRSTFFQTNFSLLASYLEATTSQNLSNKVYTITKKPIDISYTKKGEKIHKKLDGRSRENGNSQYHLILLKGSSKQYSVNEYNIRVETNVRNDTFSITKHPENYVRTNLLFFGNEQECYLSMNNSWLIDTKYLNIKLVNSEYDEGFYNCWEYNISRLLADKRIIKLSYDSISNAVVSFTGNLYDDDTHEIVYKPYNKYTREEEALSKIFVQNDNKLAAFVYFGKLSDRYTSHLTTIPELAANISHFTGLDEKKVRLHLYRAKKSTIETGYAIPAKFNLDEKIIDKILELPNFDEADFSEDGKFIVFISCKKDFDIYGNIKVKKTENMKNYQKEYQENNRDILKMHKRVSPYLKRNNGKFNPKWNEEEIEYAKSIKENN
jgi:hypothetical protein